MPALHFLDYRNHVAESRPSRQPPPTSFVFGYCFFTGGFAGALAAGADGKGCGMNPPEGAPPGVMEIPLCGSAAVGVNPMVPGMKQVMRPLLAMRISPGHAPLDNWAPVPAPYNSTANNFPAEFPATPVVIPGMS
jgi:hypothetical protein